MIDQFEPVAAEPKAIVAHLSKYHGLRDYKISDAALAMLVLFLKMTEGDRGQFQEAQSSLVCRQCGAFSCIHGYPDI